MALSAEKIDIAITSSINAMTKYIMNRDKLSVETAHEKLIEMEIYKLLIDTDSGLFLEFNDYLCECCDVELAQGIEALYKFINE